MNNIEMDSSNMADAPYGDMADAPVENSSNMNMDTNTSNIIIMTPEMCVVKCMTQEKFSLQNVISQQSNEIGLLIQERELWKSKYEEVMGQII